MGDVLLFRHIYKLFVAEPINISSFCVLCVNAYTNVYKTAFQNRHLRRLYAQFPRLSMLFRVCLKINLKNVFWNSLLTKKFVLVILLVI
jgi:hypothetical protein